MAQADGAIEKRIFLSYNRADREIAEKLARMLLDAGENVWWDRWEILAGDSLVNKIFEEGLSDASAFVILLSNNSVQSRWVREELDVATVKRIEGVTRIIPALIDNVEVPSTLRALKRVDLREDFAKGVTEITHAVHGISNKPSAATRESIGKVILPSVAGLSPAASTVAQFVLTSSDIDSGQEIAVKGSDLEDALNLGPQAINDAVDELEDNGFVRAWKALGTAPYMFLQFEPTYVLYRELAASLDYDPEEDIRVVAATVASASQIHCTHLAEQTGLSPGRLNRAVEYLDDFGLVETSKTMSSFPFRFAHLMANRRTRQFVGSA